MTIRTARTTIVAAGVLAAVTLASVAPFVEPVPAAAAPAAAAAAPPANASVFTALRPCRLADTRRGDAHRLDPSTIRVDVRSRCGVPAGAVAVALSLTMAEAAASGYLTAWPGGSARPEASNVNFTTGENRANGAIVSIGANGAIDVFTSVPAQIIVDVTGAFVPSGAAGSGRLVPIAPLRAFDTRIISPVPPGAGSDLVVPLPSGVPHDAVALAVTLTAVDSSGPGFLTAYPTGVAFPEASVLNTDAAHQTRAAGQLVAVTPAGLTVHTSAGGHVLVDVTGYVTGSSAPASGDGLYVPMATPTRVVDTRAANPVYPAGTIEIASPVAAAGALALNITLVDAKAWGYLTAYPARTPRPYTSTVNATRRGETVASMAIAPQSAAGVAVFASAGSELVADLTGWFTGAPVAAAQPRAPNLPPATCALSLNAAGLTEYFASARSPLMGADYQRSFGLPDGRVLWTFQDAFVADRWGRPVHIHNAGLLQTGGCFQLLRGGTTNAPAPWLLPELTTPFHRWFWPLGGDIGTDGDFHLFVTDMRERGPTYLSFTEPVATWVVSINLYDMTVRASHPAPNSSATLFGWSVTSDPQWTYLYSHCFRQFGWDLFPFSDPPVRVHDWDCSANVRVGRIPRGRFDVAPTYWNGAAWVADPGAAVTVIPRANRRVNPTQVRWDGQRFVAVTKEGDWWGDRIYIDVAYAAQGPWTTTGSLHVSPKCGDCNTYFASFVPFSDAGRTIIGLSNNSFDPTAFDNVVSTGVPSVYAPTFMAL